LNFIFDRMLQKSLLVFPP